MCRYAQHIYKSHFACFQCRKMFRQPSNADLPEGHRPAPGEPRMVPCPECHGAMQNMGWDFKAPRQSDVKQWKKVEILFRRGFAYHSCGCGPGPRPAALRDVPAFLAERRSQSAGEKLLQRISLAAASRRKKARQAPAGQSAVEHPLAADARRLRQRTAAAATAASLLQKKRRGKPKPPDS